MKARFENHLPSDIDLSFKASLKRSAFQFHPFVSDSGRQYISNPAAEQHKKPRLGDVQQCELAWCSGCDSGDNGCGRCACSMDFADRTPFSAHKVTVQVKEG